MRRDITFNSLVAERYGVDVAIIVHSVAFWTLRNEANGRVQADGQGWTYNTYKAWTQIYPFWTRDQVKRILKQARERGALQSQRFNEKGYDRTNWYVVTPEVRRMYGPDAEGETAPSIGRNDPLDRADVPDQYQVDSIKFNNNNSIPLPWPEHAGFVEAWEWFRQDRKDRRKPLTHKAELLNLKKLTTLTSDPDVAVRIIAQSVERGWSGLFKLKDDRQNRPLQGSDGSVLRAHLEQLGKD